MQREIKFKAYDIKNKVMVFPVAVYEDGHVGFSRQTYDKCYGKYFNPDISFEPECLGEDWYYLLNGFELLQFTGLKDSKGVEIYEGDIVKIYPESAPIDAEDKKNIMVIKWDKQGGYISDFNCGYEFDPLTGNDDLEMEIIGNLYEYPNLLENNHGK